MHVLCLDILNLVFRMSKPQLYRLFMDSCLESLNMTIVNIENLGGMWLREKRLAKQWSQETLAERSGACTKSFISQIENNKYPNKDGSPMQPSISTVDAWAEALGESCNEARRLFNYPETDEELSPDEVLEEFTYAIGRYKQLSEPMRKYFGAHVNEFLDLLINVERRPHAGDRCSARPPKRGWVGGPSNGASRQDRGHPGDHCGGCHRVEQAQIQGSKGGKRAVQRRP